MKKHTDDLRQVYIYGRMANKNNHTLKGVGLIYLSPNNNGVSLSEYNYSFDNLKLYITTISTEKLIESPKLVEKELSEKIERIIG